MNYTMRWLIFTLSVTNAPAGLWWVMFLANNILNWVVTPLITITVINAVFATSIALTVTNLFYVILLMMIAKNLMQNTKQ